MMLQYGAIKSSRMDSSQSIESVLSILIRSNATIRVDIAPYEQLPHGPQACGHTEPSYSAIVGSKDHCNRATSTGASHQPRYLRPIMLLDRPQILDSSARKRCEKFGFLAARVEHANFAKICSQMSTNDHSANDSSETSMPQPIFSLRVLSMMCLLGFTGVVESSLFKSS